MQIVTIIIFLVLIISAPWISRWWGGKGAWMWWIASMVLLLGAIFLLE